MRHRVFGHRIAAIAGIAIAFQGAFSGDSLDAAEDDANRPNILFAIADDWSSGHAGAYGCAWVETPAFDRVAREGVLFTNAFTSNPKCSPCRASILTGRNTWQLEEATQPLRPLPAQVAGLPRCPGKGRLPRRLHWQGLGPGDYEAGGFDRNPAGPAYQRAPCAAAS